jgi:glycerol-3-phosphate dehydrogenase subunit C
MLPILLMEPNSVSKRQRFSKTLMGPKRETPHPSVKDIKEQLREIRNDSLAHLDALLSELIASLAAHPNVEFSFAEDAGQAVKIIQEISDGIPIAINKSSVITNELMPALVASGLRVIETYYDQFQPFENRFINGWQLPLLEYTSILDSFDKTIDVAALREASVRRQGSKQIIGLLGVSAISAEDGAVLLIQHMHNISQVITQANKLVLVASLDKIVENLDAAVFQTRCMALFGWGALPLSIFSKADNIDRLPFEMPTEQTARKIHLIVFDNGRSRILGSSFRDLLLCIGCKACIKQCPINRFMSQNGAIWSPEDYLFMFLLGENRSMDTCLHCEACRVECPLDIDIPKLMWMAQADHAAKHGRTLRDRLLGNPELLARAGSMASPVSNVVTNIEPSKTIIEEALGLDRKRRLPSFRRETFKGWFAKRDGGNKEASPSRKVAYYVGCFANHYEPEVAKALVNVLEINGFEVVVPDQKCCGIPMIAGKNISGARKNATYNIESLAAVASEGYDIITTCPSCSLMIKREYLNLYNSVKAKLVSEHLYYVDEYLVLLHRQGALNTELAVIAESIFYHTPCHLKVQDMVGDSLELLHLIPGLSIEEVNTACCGMGGYHGYKKAHSGLSMEIGARLFEESALLARTGKVVTSCGACKLQIEAGTGAQVIHPIILLQEAYGIGRYAL